MNNSIRKYYILLFLPVVLLTSCEKVINVELDSAEMVLVAEGLIEPNRPVWLKLSYTFDYFSDEDPKYLANSDVYLSDGHGNSDTLFYEGNGKYRGTRIIGKTNKTYTLFVNELNKEYRASSTLLPPSTIENVWFEKYTSKVLGESGTKYRIHIEITNDADQDNFYLFKFYANNKLKDERYTLGNSVFFPDAAKLDYKPLSVNFEKGENVKVILYRVDENTYNYYSQLNDLVENSQGGTSTPYNPQSNFGKNVMGYFGAWSYDIFETVVE